MALNTNQTLLLAGGAAALASKLAKKKSPPPTVVNWAGTDQTDNRVILKIPSTYISSPLTQGPNNELSSNQGIVFPYTPNITVENSAAYTPVSLVHSNYNFNAYKNSAVGTINLTAKFTVQNDADAGVYLSIIHVLRALTKMPYGTDSNAGSPPPICRLFAYGNYMFNNVPVTVTSFRLDLPEAVDYYATSPINNAANLPPGNNGSWETFGYRENMVPVSSQIAIALVPQYSRYEQGRFNVTDWLSGNLTQTGNGAGYL
jgi:hypothetical protein